MRSRHFKVVGNFIAAFALTLPSVPSVAQAAPAHATSPVPWPDGALRNQPRYMTMRFVGFIAVPNATARERQKQPNYFPPALTHLNDRQGAPMTSTPERFLDTLRAAEPDYAFRLIHWGSTLLTVSTPKTGIIPAFGVFAAGRKENDPYKLTVYDRFRVIADAPTIVRINQFGEVTHLDPKTGRGQAGAGWNGGPEDSTAYVGKSQCMGVGAMSDGSYPIYAFCRGRPHKLPPGRTRRRHLSSTADCQTPHPPL